MSFLKAGRKIIYEQYLYVFVVNPLFALKGVHKYTVSQKSLRTSNIEENKAKVQITSELKFNKACYFRF